MPRQPPPSSLEDLRFDAGSLSLNLVATVGRRFGKPVERLTSVARLQEWLTAVGLVGIGTPTDDDLASLREFREKLHALFRAVVASEAPDADLVATVNEAVRRSTPQIATEGPRVALAAPSSSQRPLDAITALIAADAIRIVASEEWRNLRVCEADDCRMLYLGRGRRERRWCSSERCGNRKRVAAHRSRAGRAR